jgi:phospholipase C
MSKDPNSTAGISRRGFIGGAATTVGALALGSTAALAGKTPGGGLSSVQHVVVVMMENRSFDRPDLLRRRRGSPQHASSRA